VTESSSLPPDRHGRKPWALTLHLIGAIQWVLAAIEQVFDTTWPMIRAHEAGNDKARVAELSMMLSHKLVELAADGVTPQELRRLALETFSLTSPGSSITKRHRLEIASRVGWFQGRLPIKRLRGVIQYRGVAIIGLVHARGDRPHGHRL
jgi:hypothetical protein